MRRLLLSLFFIFSASLWGENVTPIDDPYGTPEMEAGWNQAMADIYAVEEVSIWKFIGMPVWGLPYDPSSEVIRIANGMDKYMVWEDTYTFPSDWKGWCRSGDVIARCPS